MIFIVFSPIFGLLKVARESSSRVPLKDKRQANQLFFSYFSLDYNFYLLLRLGRQKGGLSVLLHKTKGTFTNAKRRRDSLVQPHHHNAGPEASKL